jgi:hypothetical protein
MKHILLSACLLLIAISTNGQTNNPALQPCSLQLSRAPAIRGVKLGMTVDELLSLFPGSSDSLGIKDRLAAAEGYSNFGAASFPITPSNWASKERFAGVSYYDFRVFDRRVVRFDVYYEGFPTGARWQDTDDLIQRFSDSLHLPGPKDWVKDEGSSRKRLKCDGFEISASADNDRGSIAFITRSWLQTQRERLAAFEDQKRREFKPE